MIKKKNTSVIMIFLADTNGGAASTYAKESVDGRGEAHGTNEGCSRETSSGF